ncbi:MAG TPA: alpha-L-fucosidase [Candidatus Methylacidiphilales bacterium]|nr:alpha-L-fucosidase [Candidatus Methylacidiphilales bacterium]
MKLFSIRLFFTFLLCGPPFSLLRAQSPQPPTQSPSPPHPIPAIQDTETPVQRDARMAWWREAKFGMFIHWGLYSIPAGSWKSQPIAGLGEWIMNKGKIPVADYKTLPSRFNPVKFDADAWVSLAKAAGMKYMVITAKHHDGFAMYHSKVNPFNIYNATPFKRDPLAELNAAARKQGMKFGFYYSQAQDWTAPGGAAKGGHWDKAQDGDFAQYFQTKAIPQVEELLKNYSPAPAVLWFDTPYDMTPDLAAKMVTVLNKHPNLIWNNRLGGGYPGDTETPEQRIPPKGYPGKDWETCMTINNTWGYKADDLNFKSTETLLHNLIDIVSKGGNYLLNVGPDATGVIPQPEQDRLREIGRWLSVNGEAIYGAGPTAFGNEDGSFSATEKDKNGAPRFEPAWEWRCTTKPGKIYIHIFQWPTGPFALDKVPGKITHAYLLADPAHKPVKFTQTGTNSSLHLPAKALDPIATVLVLETK